MIYFDSAATSKKPFDVINRIPQFYVLYDANVHRGNCKESINATNAMEASRKYVSDFIGSTSERQIIFTSGTTESLNTLAYSLCKSFIAPEKDIILLTELEHNANICCWQKHCTETTNKKIAYIPVLQSGLLDYDWLQNFLKTNGKRVFVCSFTMVNNAIGTMVKVKKIIDLCHEYNIMVSLDAAQAIAHFPINVSELDCEFLSFSGHKTYAPYGIGVLYGKNEYLQRMFPLKEGGGSVTSVSEEEIDYKEHPERFESGTPNLEGINGLENAFRWINTIGWKTIQNEEHQLYLYAVSKLMELQKFKIIGSPEYSSGIISIVHNKKTAIEISKILNGNNICVRAGWHCNHLLMKKLGLKDGTVRISFSFNNNITEQIDYLVNVLQSIN